MGHEKSETTRVFKTRVIQEILLWVQMQPFFVRKIQVNKTGHNGKMLELRKRMEITLNKKFFYLILQVTGIIGVVLFAYYFVFNKQMIRVIVWTVMVISILLLGIYLRNNLKRNGKDN
jgi:hypothetical protein